MSEKKPWLSAVIQSWDEDVASGMELSSAALEEIENEEDFLLLVDFLSKHLDVHAITEFDAEETVEFLKNLSNCMRANDVNVLLERQGVKNPYGRIAYFFVLALADPSG